MLIQTIELASLQSKLAQLMHINVQCQPVIHYTAGGEPAQAFKIEYVNKALCVHLMSTHKEYLQGLIFPSVDVGNYFKMTPDCLFR